MKSIYIKVLLITLLTFFLVSCAPESKSPHDVGGVLGGDVSWQQNWSKSFFPEESVFDLWSTSAPFVRLAAMVLFAALAWQLFAHWVDLKSSNEAWMVILKLLALILLVVCSAGIIDLLRRAFEVGSGELGFTTFETKMGWDITYQSNFFANSLVIDNTIRLLKETLPNATKLVVWIMVVLYFMGVAYIVITHNPRILLAFIPVVLGVWFYPIMLGKMLDSISGSIATEVAAKNPDPNVYIGANSLLGISVWLAFAVCLLLPMLAYVAALIYSTGAVSFAAVFVRGRHGGVSMDSAVSVGNQGAGQPGGFSVSTQGPVLRDLVDAENAKPSAAAPTSRADAQKNTFVPDSSAPHKNSGSRGGLNPNDQPGAAPYVDGNGATVHNSGIATESGSASQSSYSDWASSVGNDFEFSNANASDASGDWTRDFDDQDRVRNA